MKSRVIYWRADFPTDRLKELCKLSKSDNWHRHEKRHFVRRAGCQDINNFRFAVVEEIEKLHNKLSADQKRWHDRARRSMNPRRRRKTEDFLAGERQKLQK